MADLKMDSLTLAISEGAEKYNMVVRVDEAKGVIRFVFSHVTAVPDALGVIDADPMGVIEKGSDGFVAVYRDGWEPPAHLAEVIERALRKAYIMSRPRVASYREGEKN